ncbi:MAG: TonB-dependent receptor [Flavobacteriales bacterium]|nr:TonB-dependent receptor [Flavobacteriales bacterium]
MGIGKIFLVRNGLTWMMPEVRNTNYENRSQNMSWGQLNSALMMRKEAHQFQLEGRYDSRMNVLKPNFTFEYSYRWHFHKLSLTPGVMVAQQCRYPDFNELFWIPGGNRDLEPEEGKMLEARLNVLFNLSKYFNFESGMKYVNRHVTNWIQWIPGTGGYWSPVNYKTVRTSGMEFPVKLYGSYRDIIWKLEGNYRFTEALFVNDQVWNSAEARYLSYTPKHTWHAGVEVGYREGFMRFRHNYYSERFTEESNLIYRSLPAYSLCYIEVGTAINLKQIVIKPSISVDNVFDVAYQSIRSYAMPGRVTQLNIQISYLQKNK